MKLEILTAPAQGTPKPFKLLFVHGICVGGWIWQQHFLPYFAAAGYESHAVSLRGHGGSEGTESLAHNTLKDYTDDLDAAATIIGGPLIVIGHSLGGAVAQNWLRTGGKAAGVALLTSVPPWGLASSAMRMGFTNPMLFAELSKMVAMGVNNINPDVLRSGLFSDDFPPAEFATFTNRVQNESAIVSMELQGFRAFAPLPWQTTPMFVLGAANDKLIPADEVAKTGTYYNTGSTIVENLAHTVMLDTNWEAAATPLLTWINSLTP